MRTEEDVGGPVYCTKKERTHREPRPNLSDILRAIRVGDKDASGRAELYKQRPLAQEFTGNQVL